jgi:hypothetical protein
MRGHCRRCTCTVLDLLRSGLGSCAGYRAHTKLHSYTLVADRTGAQLHQLLISVLPIRTAPASREASRSSS